MCDEADYLFHFIFFCFFFRVWKPDETLALVFEILHKPRGILIEHVKNW